MVSINAEDNQEKTTERVKTYTNWMKTGVNMGNGIKSIILKPTLNTGLDAAKELLDSISTALGSNGLILSAVASLLVLFKEAVPTDRQVMLQQFERTHLRFDAMHSELEEIKHLIGEIPEKVELHARIAEVEILILAFQRLQRSPMTEIDDFRRKCDNNPPDGTLDYIYIHRGAIKDGVARRYDRLALLQTMQALGITQLNALKMYEACQAVKAADLPVGQREQYLNDKRQNVEEFRWNIKAVIQMLYDAEAHIIKNFFVEHAKTEIDNFVAGHSNLGNRDLAVKLYNMLQTKYYWRHFATGVYSGDAVGFAQHIYYAHNDYAHYRYRHNGRSWFVIMSRLGQSDNTQFESGVLKCINDRIPAPSNSDENDVEYDGEYSSHSSNIKIQETCQILLDDRYTYPYDINMKKCIANYGYVAIVCVRHGNGLVWMANKEGSTIVDGNFDDGNGMALSILVAH